MTSVDALKAKDDQLEALLLGMKLAALHIDRLKAESREKDERIEKLKEEAAAQLATLNRWIDCYHTMRDEKDAQVLVLKARIRQIFGQFIGNWLMKI